MLGQSTEVSLVRAKGYLLGILMLGLKRQVPFQNRIGESDLGSLLLGGTSKVIY